MSEPTYVAETLAWCNERRVAQGKKPLKQLPKGKRHDGWSCPCGTATGLRVGTRRYWKPDHLPSERVPAAVTEFVIAFDGGQLPQYEAKS